MSLPGVFHLYWRILLSTLLCCCILCSGSFSVFAKDEIGEVSTDRLALFSTLPYLKYLGREHIQSGKLHLYVMPQDASIYLDGKPLNALKLDGMLIVRRVEERTLFLTLENLVPGTHTLRVTKSSYNTRLKYVSIESGRTRYLRVRLRNRWRIFAAEMLTLASLTAMGIAFFALIQA